MKNQFVKVPVGGMTAEEILALWQKGELYYRNEKLRETDEEAIARCQREALEYVRAISVYATQTWVPHIERLWQRIVMAEGFASDFVMKKKRQLNRYYVTGIVYNLQTLGVYCSTEEVSQLRLHLTMEGIRQKNGIFKNWGQYAISSTQRKCLQALMNDFLTSLK